MVFSAEPSSRISTMAWCINSHSFGRCASVGVNDNYFSFRIDSRIL